MEAKIEAHQDLDSLEFQLLKELPKLRVVISLTTDEQKEKKTQYLLNIKNRIEKISRVERVFEVINEVEDGFVCIQENYNYPILFIRDCFKLEVGCVYFYLNKSYEDENYIIKVSDDFADDIKSEDFFGEMDKWEEDGGQDTYGRNNREYNNSLIEIKDIKGGEITFDVVRNKFDLYKKELKKEEEERKEKERIEEEQRVIEEGGEKELYDSEGEAVFQRFSVLKKTITDYREGLTLNKNVNETFSYEEIKGVGNADYNNTILSSVEIFLNDKKISYTKKTKKGSGYRVTYTNDKCKINDVNIPFAKIKFILNRIYSKGGTKDEIKILVKLNGMKVDFVSLENLKLRDVDNIELPIVNKAIDDKVFEIEFLGEKKTFDWDVIKKLFFYDGNSRSIECSLDNEFLLKFCGDMGVEKKYLFKTLKRLKMLNSLKDEDNN